MRIIYSAQAQRDLEDIRRWIARDNPARALTFTRDLRSRIWALRDWPQRCELFDASRFPDIHRLVYRGYRIIYKVAIGELVVLHVHHGARDEPPLN